MRKLLAATIVAGLLVAHQDYWQWNRNELVFGFLPHTMAWHMALCLVTALAWFLITQMCWPAAAGGTPPASAANLDDFRKTPKDGTGGPDGGNPGVPRP